MTTATDVGFVEMRIAKVVGLMHGDEKLLCVVLDEVAVRIAWPRPMTYQLTAALVQALGGRVRQVRIDRLVEKAYGATVEVEGPLGVQSVDARPSDVLNLAALVDAPIFVAAEMLEEGEAGRAGDSAEAAYLRQALVAAPMTVGTVGM